MGRSYFQRLAITEHYTNILPTPTRNSTSVGNTGTAYAHGSGSINML